MYFEKLLTGRLLFDVFWIKRKNSMTMVKTHHDLKVWRDSLSYSVLVYGITETFPARERYGLTSQIRRSAISIPSNIAEGASRTSPREFKYFVSVALASATELETQLEIAYRLGILNNPKILAEPLANIRMMLIKLRQALVKKIQNTPNAESRT